MRCSIDCIEFLKEYYEFNNKQLEIDFQLGIRQNGISIYEFVLLCNKNRLLIQAIHTVFVPKRLPCIVYQKQSECGHYYVLIKRNRWSFVLHDPMVGVKKVNIIWFYLFFSHLCLICYNDKKKR